MRRADGRVLACPWHQPLLQSPCVHGEVHACKSAGCMLGSRPGAPFLSVCVCVSGRGEHKRLSSVTEAGEPRTDGASSLVTHGRAC